MGRDLRKRAFTAWEIGLLAALALALISGCEADNSGVQDIDLKSPAVQAKRRAFLSARAGDLGKKRAAETVFRAQEIALLDPRSERAKTSRRALHLVEQITDTRASDSRRSPPKKPVPDKPTPQPQKSP